MTAWNSVPLAQLASASGATAGKSTDLPVYSVTKHRGFVASLEYFNKQVFSRELSSYTVVEPGDFAYATIHLDEGSIGICPERCLISPMYTAFRISNERLYPLFLIRYLKSPRALAEYPRLGKGSVERRRAISFERLAQLEIPVPPLSEQRRIAAILDKVDESRAKRRAALTMLGSLGRALFVDLFGELQQERERWPLVPLEKIVRETKLGLVRGAQEFGPDYPIPYVRMNAITRNGEIDLEAVQRTHATAAEVEAYCLQPGDLLFNTRNSKELVGKTGMFREEGTYVFNNNLMRMRFIAEADPFFVTAAFQTPFVQHELSLRKSGTTNVFAIYYKDLRSLPIPLPPIQLQRKFARHIAAIENLKAAHRISLAQLNALFASLEQRAFRGEL